MDFENTFFFFKKKVFENQLHRQGPTGCANLIACVLGKLRVSSDFYKRDRTRDLKTRCAKVFIKKGHKMHSGCLERRTGLEIKGHFLSIGLKLQAKAI